MFNKDYTFQWEHLGDVALGRPNLGDKAGVRMYRLMQYTLREAMIQHFGPEVAGRILVEAGRRAGLALSQAMLDKTKPFDLFAADLARLLLEEGVGVLRIERANLGELSFELTVDEDLDCSGLPPKGDAVCDYDEGFIAGVFEAYTGKSFIAKEIDCWASGGRTCRFTVDVDKS